MVSEMGMVPLDVLRNEQPNYAQNYLKIVKNIGRLMLFIGDQSIEIPTGIPFACDLDENLRPKDRFYLKSNDDCKMPLLDKSSSSRELPNGRKM